MRKFIKKLNHYFDSTTLHGFIYISRGSHFAEKTFWILAIFSSFVCCSWIFYQLYSKYDSNQVIVYQPDTAVHISKIPFPSVSVCAYSMVNYSYDIFSSLLKNKTYSYPFEISRPKTNLNSNNSEAYIQFYIEYLSFWIEKYKPKPEIIISDIGWCQSFNLVEFNEMFHYNSVSSYFRLHDGKMSKAKTKKIYQNLTEVSPLFTIRKEFGFVFGLTIDRNYYADYGTGIKNWMWNNWQVKVVVHSPFEIPDKRHKSFVVNQREIFKLQVAAQIRITDESLLGANFDSRRCYKPDERQLQYFKTYTSINCLRECESSFILQKCGCVPYYFISNDTSLICSTTQLDCFEKEYEEFDEVKCRCYPLCEEIGYEISTQRIVTTYPFPELGNAANSKITANFKDNGFYPQIRRKYFTMIDWFSFVGGILGLFFGFSFLSAFEVIFHFWRGIFRHGEGRMSRVARTNGTKHKIRKYLRKFLRSSSIHGLKYVSDSNLKLYERLAWIISFILSITTCIYMITELRLKMSIDTTSIVLDDTLFNISQLTFPAVTVVEKPNESNDMTWMKEAGINLDFFNPRAHYANEHVQIRSIVQSLIRRVHDSQIKTAQVTFPRNITNYGHKIVQYIQKDYKSFRFLTMAWNKEYSVPKAEILTSYGVGLVFNIAEKEYLFNLDMEDDAVCVSQDFFYEYSGYFNGSTNIYSIDYVYNWYRDWKIRNLTLPWTAVYSKDESLIAYSFRSELSLYMFLHSPYEHPVHIDMDSPNVFEIYKDRTIEVWITPDIVTSSDDFMKLPLRTRMCYLENEMNLKFFKVYTQQNCEIECLSAKLLESCGCVPYDVIRSNATKVCELFDYICVDDAKDKFLIETVRDSQCNCLQPCNYIKYNYEFEELTSKEKVVKFKFKDNEFTSMKRVRQFTIFDFLSYIGGLLGLFAGISVLSIFEIFYYFTLRLICEVLRVRSYRMKIRCGHTVNIVAPKTKV